MIDDLSGDGDKPTHDQVLEAVFEALPMGLMLFDAEDRLLHCNATARDFFAPIGETIKPGARFEDMARHMAEKAVRLNGANASVQGRVG